MRVAPPAFLLALILSAALTAAELTPDPTVVQGTLPNGLRYALRHNEQPRDKVTLRLQVQCGSLQEDEVQRGLAHYLEHLAFNGTTHFPPGTLVERLQHLGLAFGAHTNAHTSFEETVYKLDLPDAKPETIDTGLTVMADWAGGMLIEPAEVERERGVILAELRDRDGPGLRQARLSYAARYPGTVIADRLPIGHAQTIQAATRDRIAAYYHAWYRPERMVLAVVGAIDPAPIRSRIEALLGGLAAPAPAPVEPPRGTLRPAPEPTALVGVDPEAEATTVAFTRTMPEPRPIDSPDQRRDELVRALGESVFSRRLRRLIEQDPDCPLQQVGAFSYHWAGFAHLGVQGRAKPKRAADALVLAVREYKRLLDHGPTAGELRIAAAAWATDLDTAVAQAETRNNAELAGMMYNSIFLGQTILSPVQERDLQRPWLAAITSAEVVASLGAYRSRPGNELAEILGREDLGAGAGPRIAELVKAAWREAVAPPVDAAVAPWAYALDPAARAPADGWIDATDAASGVASRSRTGLRIQTRLNRAQPNQVLIRLRFETGVGKPAPGVAELIDRGFIAGGLGRHAADEESTLFADSSVRLDGILVAADAVILGATCTPADYHRALERLAAHVADPGWRPEAESRIKQAWLEELAAGEADVEAQVERRLATRLVADDPARRPATRGEAEATTFAQAKAWLMPILATAPLTVTVCGDAAGAKGSPEAVFVGAVRRPFAAAADASTVRAGLPPSAPPPAGIQRLQVTAQVAKAQVRIVWPGDDIYDIRQTRRLGLLAQCLGERLRIVIRQKLGAAYSPAAWNVADDAYRGFGGIHASIGVAPGQADTVVTEVLDLADAIAADGVDPAIFDQVKTPAVKSLAARIQRNDWWAGVVMPRLATQPFRLDWARDIETDYQAITAAELSALARRYLVRSAALVVIGVAQPATEIP